MRNYPRLLVVVILVISLTFCSSTPKIEGTFDELYPKPFLETKLGKGVIYSSVILATIIATVFTVKTGGAGGPLLAQASPAVKMIATQIGLLAGYGSGSTAAGLAIMGGGTVASGGFGMMGGTVAIGSLINIGSGVIVDVAVDQAINAIQKEPYKRFEYLKLPLIEKGSDDVVELVKKIKKAEEDFFKGKISLNNYKVLLEQKYVPTLEKRLQGNTIITTKETAYDLINRAILQFNKGQYNLSEQDFKTALSYADKSSFILYSLALNSLINNNYPDALSKLGLANTQEPTALQPYILHVMALKDTGKYQEALLLAKTGLDNTGKNFSLSWEAGEICFHHLKTYKDAAKFYEIAYDKVGEDVVEAEAAMMVALSFKKMTDNEQAIEWYKKALKKVEKNADQKRKIEEMWRKA